MKSLNVYTYEASKYVYKNLNITAHDDLKSFNDSLPEIPNHGENNNLNNQNPSLNINRQTYKSRYNNNSNNHHIRLQNSF